MLWLHVRACVRQQGTEHRRGDRKLAQPVRAGQGEERSQGPYVRHSSKLREKEPNEQQRDDFLGNSRDRRQR